MAFSPLPLSYCTNVHAARTADEVTHGLRQYTQPVRENVGQLAAGLWLARSVVTDLLSHADGVPRLKDVLEECGLTCYTLNTFPFGDFHQDRVKENVYLPDWTEDSRAQYTLDCADVLARLLPDDRTIGSLSTVPLGFKPFEHPLHFVDQCAGRLIDVAQGLEKLRSETGRTIRLAIEPEPFCVLETTGELLRFFERLHELADDRRSLAAVQDLIGVCYDVCHQSVEFEDVADSIRQIDEAGIRIAKVHITCAIRVEQPDRIEAREALARFVEPRYLHQTLARDAGGSIHRLVDLTSEDVRNPSAGFKGADEWRVHYHVPVNAESLGPLSTTRNDLKLALAAIRGLGDTPHLEVETYTWDVLPDGSRIPLVDGLTAELVATRQLLDELTAQRGL